MWKIKISILLLDRLEGFPHCCGFEVQSTLSHAQPGHTGSVCFSAFSEDGEIQSDIRLRTRIEPWNPCFGASICHRENPFDCCHRSLDVLDIASSPSIRSATKTKNAERNREDVCGESAQIAKPATGSVILGSATLLPLAFLGDCDLI